MTKTKRQLVGELVRGIARLWSFPLIGLTFLLVAKDFIPMPFQIDRYPFIGALLSPYAMGFAVAFVVAWHWERVGGWVALWFAGVYMVCYTIRSEHLPLSLFDLVFWSPAVLFLVSASLHRVAGQAEATAPDKDAGQAAQNKLRRFFALPRSELGWWSLVIGAGFFVFLRLFWMQAGSPGRDRSTFFSDPVNAACLIGAFGSPIAGMIVALAAIIWKRERSLLLAPLLLLGLLALLWAVAVLSGANA